MEAQVSNICLSIHNLRKRKGGWGQPGYLSMDKYLIIYANKTCKQR